MLKVKEKVTSVWQNHALGNFVQYEQDYYKTVFCLYQTVLWCLVGRISKTEHQGLISLRKTMILIIPRFHGTKILSSS